MTATTHVAVSTALRNQIVESCARDQTKAFVAWLLGGFNQPDFRSIAAGTANWEGADQHFQIVATLGFAADAGVLSEPQLAALKNALRRLSGFSPMVNGLPRPFCSDAVGILGIAVGTAAIANAELTGQVVQWATPLLRRIYRRERTADWHRCLFAAADRKLGAPLNLPVPNSTSVADVRLALLAKGMITYPDTQVQQDAARVLDIAIEQTSRGGDCERAALCLAAVEWVIRREGEQGDRAGDLIEHINTNPAPTLQEHKQSDIDARPRKKRGRPAEIPDELKEKALAVQGITARARILYQTQHPTPQQKKNVSAILRNYRRKFTAT